MKNEKLQIIPISFEIVEQIDTRFTSVKINLMHVGLNLNNSIFHKETVEKCWWSLENTPILGFIEVTKENEKDFTGHKNILLVEKGNYVLKYAGQAFGVIPKDCNPRWEFKKASDGIEREYLVCDGILWSGKFSDVKEIIDRDNVKKESMELDDNFDGKFNDDGTFEFTNFKFYGACILGDNKREAMTGASIEKVFSISEIEEQIQSQMELLKFTLENKDYIKKEDMGTGEKISVDLSKDAADMSGSWGDVNKTKLRNDILKASNYKSLVSKCYLMVKDGWEDSPSTSLKYPVCKISDNTLILSANGCKAALSFLEKNTDDSDYSKAKSKLKKYYTILDLDTSNFEVKGENKLNKEKFLEILSKYEKLKEEDCIDIVSNLETYTEETLEIAIKELSDKIQVFEMTSNQLREAVKLELSKRTIEAKDYWGDEYETQEYYFEDIKGDIIIVLEYTWKHYYGIPFTVNRDSVSLDFDSKVEYLPDWRIKESTESPDVEIESEFINKIFENVNKKIEGIKNSFNILESELKIKYDLIEKENEELKEFKKQSLTAQRKESEDALFEKFSEKLTEDEMLPIKEKVDNFTIEQLEEKLYALVAKKIVKFETFEPKVKIRVNFEKDEPINNEPVYADLIRKHINK